MVPAHYLDDAFIRTKYYISPKNVTLKKRLDYKLINDIIYKFRSIIVLQILSVITEQLKHCLAEELIYYRNGNASYVSVESADQSKQFVTATSQKIQKFSINISGVIT